MPNPDTPAISVRGAVKQYGALQALAGVDLDIHQGEFFGLLGPNGAGKTTLISSLAGLVRLSAGEIRVMGHEVVRDYREARRKLGVVPQELVFDPFFSVRELLRIQSGYFGIRRNDDWIDELLANLDLSHKADINMRALSGGMKRRVLVAQALVHKPPVIVLDEPTAGVDVELRQTLWQFIRKLNRDDHTIVLTTHYLEEAEELCGRIAMLKQGRIVALDSTPNILRRVSQRALQIRAAGMPDVLPTFLAEHLLARESGVLQLRFDRHAEIEGLLAAVRESGALIEDIAITQPDLEQAFVEIMQENSR
ncbi:MAG: ABC transporter ATP-binding protein [Candidatus Dactylopiibacterium carminicum]|uniref:ABC transporter ATP-binding protein n=1 Tax=Candidatus Dactylopiibacterium carminicum TaxID=857335 RepID=A0A272ESK4_9RHOO|nr:ABC transporter ATP-binding protein [Candidatus Dactylopiibacterium carminicum]KAF7599074.1 ABC transporter ATP-binding protein [Candidatus Dactylopiibacterium carminicum]PAS93075.1 MAG: ABC transporter ATP-binding protein [Candidatus Dactylopiibacterium carminicum]PAS96640.1 MAG: ABC transporter ATP-binding protein [Candidatus Dactylopiibacterium carminicum]PAS99085.1 MAG: ABC transporter ATP-binding protein [Candidatus Dactylopiibacterium carminicum]